MNQRLKHTVQGSLLGGLLLCAPVSGFPQEESSLLLTPAANGPASPIPLSNSVSHMETEAGVLWIGTGKGLARTPDSGRTWESFRGVPQFASPGIFALALRGDTVWTSTGYTKDVEGQSVQTGSGYAYSLDNGRTWSQVPQTLDGRADSLVTYGSQVVRFLPIVVPEQNVTFDIAVTDSFVWIASWSSGLRRSSDRGQTWQRVVLPGGGRNSIAPSDSLGYYKVDPRKDNNFLAFSVTAESDSVIWSGSAGGINRSTDGGLSWVNFNTRNQLSPILGNWVIAIKTQRVSGITRLWTTNWATDSTEEYGVSYSDDGGRIWKNFLHGVKAFAFATRDSVVYIATERGVYRTADGGESWSVSGSIIDPTRGARIATEAFYTVGVLGDTVFCGSGDGIARTVDRPSEPFGRTWEIFRSYRPVGSSGATYAYPNPFSPRFEVTRVHYGLTAPSTVSLEVFDFGMNRLRTVVKDASRMGSMEYDEIWDGKNDDGSIVPNGVYFYRLTVAGLDPSWGKIMILQ